jgi:hypothetical protein
MHKTKPPPDTWRSKPQITHLGTTRIIAAGAMVLPFSSCSSELPWLQNATRKARRHYKSLEKMGQIGRLFPLPREQRSCKETKLCAAAEHYKQQHRCSFLAQFSWPNLNGQIWAANPNLEDRRQDSHSGVHPLVTTNSRPIRFAGSDGQSRIFVPTLEVFGPCPFHVHMATPTISPKKQKIVVKSATNWLKGHCFKSLLIFK